MNYISQRASICVLKNELPGVLDPHHWETPWSNSKKKQKHFFNHNLNADLNFLRFFSNRTKGQLCPPLPIMLWLALHSYSTQWCHSHWLIVAVRLLLCGTVWAAGITVFSLELWAETRLSHGQEGLRQSGCFRPSTELWTLAQAKNDLWFSSSSFLWNTLLCKLNLGVGHIFLLLFPSHSDHFHALSVLVSHKMFIILSL